MVFLRVGACVPASCFRMSAKCTCGSCQCGLSNEHPSEDDKLGHYAPVAPQQFEMRDVALTIKASASKIFAVEEDAESTSTASSSAGADESPKAVKAADAISRTNTEILEEGWFTPSLGVATPAMSPPAASSQHGSASCPVEAAVAAALAPHSSSDGEAVLRHRHSADDVCIAQRRADWWDDADTKAVPGLEIAPSLCRLVGADIIPHPGLAKSKRPAPWISDEAPACYARLGARDSSSSYVAWWLNVGDNSLVTVSEVVDRAAFERCLAGDLLGKRVKMLIRAVKCPLPFPGKGPKEADTVGAFFGKGASLNRIKTPEGTDVTVIQIDLYYLMMLRFALQNVGFRQGNVVDIILVDWPGQAVLTACRLTVTTDAFNKLKG